MQATEQNVLEPSEQTRVLVTTGFYYPAFRGGGPIQTLRALVAAAPAEFTIDVICSNRDLGVATPLVGEPNRWLQVGRARVLYVEGGLPRLYAAYRSSGYVDIVYLNSLFNPHFSLLPLVLHRLGLWRGASLLLAPRGELSPGALALKSRKKRLFIKTLKALGFPRMILWHASTEEEASHIRAVFGGDSRIVVRENETSLPLNAQERPPNADRMPHLLFASRLVPKKGLITLLEAMSAVHLPVHIDIVGAFEDATYEAWCLASVRRLPSNVSISFHGALAREDVLLKMRMADLMVLPTAGENFGHVIAEALSQSCPVMCSPHTPWTKRLRSGGGAVISSDSPEAWAVALNGYLASGPGAWRESSARAGRCFDEWRNAHKGRHVFELCRLLASDGQPGSSSSD